MTWPLLSLKLPPELLAAVKDRDNWPAFVRQTLAAELGMEIKERQSGLAGASARTRKRVSRAGVKARRQSQ
jgi:hypothetical protein